MNQYRTIAVVGSAQERVKSNRFTASNISKESVGASIDPILGIDHFAIRGPIFPPHPHAGFTPITYLFEDSEGSFISRVSNGETHESKPGGVIWNVSGSGLLHEEYPKTQGQLSKGLQVLINLSAENKMLTPKVYFVDGPDIPVYTEDGLRIRVISGKINNIAAKIDPPGEITFLDIRMQAGYRFEAQLPEQDNVLVYVLDGTVLAGADNRPLHAGSAATLNFDGTYVSMQSENQAAQIILISGKALNEPIVKHGSVVGNTGGQTSFVMNTQEQIDLALERYYSGKMGYLEPANDYSNLI